MSREAEAEVFAEWNWTRTGQSVGRTSAAGVPGMEKHLLDAEMKDLKNSAQMARSERSGMSEVRRYAFCFPFVDSLTSGSEELALRKSQGLYYMTLVRVD
jgi:hypothetical protein